MADLVKVRLSQARDLNALASNGVAVSPDTSIFVAVRGDEELLGALVVHETAFETEQLGLKSARVVSFRAWRRPEEALPMLVAACREWLVSKGIQFVACRVGVDDKCAVSVLKKHGFEDVETLLTFRRSLSQIGETEDNTAAIDIAVPEDAADCSRIAGNCFSSDRFHRDDKIDHGAAGRLKKTWVENAFRGRADAIFVARNASGETVGFNICLVTDEAAVIDLICVRSDARGQGLARGLVQKAMSYYAGQRHEMRVGTQSTNQASISLYQSCGFQVMSSSKTLHLHLD